MTFLLIFTRIARIAQIARKCRLGLTALVALIAAPALAAPSVDFDAMVDDYYHRTGSDAIPGMLVGVWEGGEALALVRRGYGDLGLDSGLPPVDIGWNDQMRVASLTKTFTVTRIVQLAADGVLDLDDPITVYGGPGGIDLAGLNFRGGVPPTLRQLADMTSGLADYSRNPAFQDAWFADLTQPWEAQQLIDYAKGGEVSPTLWEYSNTNTVLLGMVIEAVTGRTVKEEIERLVQDAGLSTSTTYYPEELDFKEGGVARGYNYDGDEAAFVDFTDTHPSAAGAAGGMISTLHDLKDWARIIATGISLDGTPLYSATENERWQAERLEWIAPDGSGPHYDLYALGIGSINGWIGHTGEFLGYQHLMMHDATTDRTIVIMINRAGFIGGDHVPTDLFLDLSKALVIPEPSGVALLLMAGGAAWWFERRRRRTT